MLLHRDLDEAQSSQQENSFDSQKGVADLMGRARFRQERIEQRTVTA